jgi:hypothetical protein
MSSVEEEGQVEVAVAPLAVLVINADLWPLPSTPFFWHGGATLVSGPVLLRV